ncbi:MAG: hypothetical protein ACK5HY_14350, partial [Parahaliea sp.]
HAVLLTYTEAYSVVAHLASRLKSGEALEEQDSITLALKLGRQAYMQRRISSESSIGKLLFKNGYQLLRSRHLTEAGGAELAEQRNALFRELRQIQRRLEVIRAQALANSASAEEEFGTVAHRESGAATTPAT